MSDAPREAVAKAMWELIADRMDDPKRGPCRNGPIERESIGGGKIRNRAQRWDESDGAWRQEMLDMAEAAIEALATDAVQIEALLRLRELLMLIPNETDRKTAREALAYVAAAAVQDREPMCDVCGYLAHEGVCPGRGNDGL